MNTKAFTFTKDDQLNNLLSSTGHPLISDAAISYRGKIEEAEKHHSSVPMLSMERDGSVILSVNHTCCIKKPSDMEEKYSEYYHLTVHTIVPSSEEFIPDKQTDIDIIKSFSETSTIQTLCHPSLT